MFNCDQFTALILRPALEEIDLYSLKAERLLLGTMAQESNFGTYLKQVNGPALGIFQMEPRTYYDLWNTILKNDLKLATLIRNDYPSKQVIDPEEMIYNLKFACKMARVFYYRIKEEIPDSSDPNEIFKYYKKYWNTSLGDTTQQEFLASYKKYIA